ncbi:819_t:CDS:2, partial [Entrophospora sp. SA101]
MEKELGNSTEIKLVSPSVVRVIQAGGEISEDLKKAKIIFFPINNSENHETGDTGRKILGGYHYNSLDSSITDNAKKLTDKFRQKLSIKEEKHVLYPAKNLPQQTDGADCGVYVIAFTRALIKRFREDNSYHNWGLKEEDLIFPIAEERQKLKAVGFPKKDNIGDDVEYLEKNLTKADSFKEFSKKVRLL